MKQRFNFTKKEKKTSPAQKPEDVEIEEAAPQTASEKGVAVNEIRYTPKAPLEEFKAVDYKALKGPSTKGLTDSVEMILSSMDDKLLGLHFESASKVYAEKAAKDQALVFEAYGMNQGDVNIAEYVNQIAHPTSIDVSAIKGVFSDASAMLGPYFIAGHPISAGALYALSSLLPPAMLTQIADEKAVRLTSHITLDQIVPRLPLYNPKQMGVKERLAQWKSIGLPVVPITKIPSIVHTEFVYEDFEGDRREVRTQVPWTLLTGQARIDIVGTQEDGVSVAQLSDPEFKPKFRDGRVDVAMVKIVAALLTSPRFSDRHFGEKCRRIMQATLTTYALNSGTPAGGIGRLKATVDIVKYGTAYLDAYRAKWIAANPNHLSILTNDQWDESKKDLINAISLQVANGYVEYVDVEQFHYMEGRAEKFFPGNAKRGVPMDENAINVAKSMYLAMSPFGERPVWLSYPFPRVPDVIEALMKATGFNPLFVNAIAEPGVVWMTSFEGITRLETTAADMWIASFFMAQSWAAYKNKGKHLEQFLGNVQSFYVSHMKEKFEIGKWKKVFEKWRFYYAANGFANIPGAMLFEPINKEWVESPAVGKQVVRRYVNCLSKPWESCSLLGFNPFANGVARYLYDAAEIVEKNGFALRLMSDNLFWLLPVRDNSFIENTQDFIKFNGEKVKGHDFVHISEDGVSMESTGTQGSVFAEMHTVASEYWGVDVELVFSGQEVEITFLPRPDGSLHPVWASYLYHEAPLLGNDTPAVYATSQCIVPGNPSGVFATTITNHFGMSRVAGKTLINMVMKHPLFHEADIEAKAEALTSVIAFGPFAGKDNSLVNTIFHDKEHVWKQIVGGDHFKGPVYGRCDEVNPDDRRIGRMLDHHVFPNHLPVEDKFLNIDLTAAQFGSIVTGVPLSVVAQTGEFQGKGVLQLLYEYPATEVILDLLGFNVMRISLPVLPGKAAVIIQKLAAEREYRSIWYIKAAIKAANDDASESSSYAEARRERERLEQEATEIDEEALLEINSDRYNSLREFVIAMVSKLNSLLFAGIFFSEVGGYLLMTRLQNLLVVLDRNRLLNPEFEALTREIWGKADSILFGAESTGDNGQNSAYDDEWNPLFNLPMNFSVPSVGTVLDQSATIPFLEDGNVVEKKPSYGIFHFLFESQRNEDGFIALARLIGYPNLITYTRLALFNELGARPFMWVVNSETHQEEMLINPLLEEDLYKGDSFVQAFLTTVQFLQEPRGRFWKDAQEALYTISERLANRQAAAAQEEVILAAIKERQVGNRGEPVDAAPETDEIVESPADSALRATPLAWFALGHKNPHNFTSTSTPIVVAVEKSVTVAKLQQDLTEGLVVKAFGGVPASIPTGATAPKLDVDRSDLLLLLFRESFRVIPSTFSFYQNVGKELSNPSSPSTKLDQMVGLILRYSGLSAHYRSNIIALRDCVEIARTGIVFDPWGESHNFLFQGDTKANRPTFETRMKQVDNEAGLMNAVFTFYSRAGVALPLWAFARLLAVKYQDRRIAVAPNVFYKAANIFYRAYRDRFTQTGGLGVMAFMVEKFIAPPAFREIYNGYPSVEEKPSFEEFVRFIITPPDRGFLANNEPPSHKAYEATPRITFEGEEPNLPFVPVPQAVAPSGKPFKFPKQKPLEPFDIRVENALNDSRQLLAVVEKDVMEPSEATYSLRSVPYSAEVQEVKPEAPITVRSIGQKEYMQQVRAGTPSEALVFNKKTFKDKAQAYDALLKSRARLQETAALVRAEIKAKKEVDAARARKAAKKQAKDVVEGERLQPNGELESPELTAAIKLEQQVEAQIKAEEKAMRSLDAERAMKGRTQQLTKARQRFRDQAFEAWYPLLVEHLRPVFTAAQAKGAIQEILAKYTPVGSWVYFAFKDVLNKMREYGYAPRELLANFDRLIHYLTFMTIRDPQRDIGGVRDPLSKDFGGVTEFERVGMRPIVLRGKPWAGDMKTLLEESDRGLKRAYHSPAGDFPLAK